MQRFSIVEVKEDIILYSGFVSLEDITGEPEIEDSIRANYAEGKYYFNIIHCIFSDTDSTEIDMPEEDVDLLVDVLFDAISDNIVYQVSMKSYSGELESVEDTELVEG